MPEYFAHIPNTRLRNFFVTADTIYCTAFVGQCDGIHYQYRVYPHSEALTANTHDWGVFLYHVHLLEIHRCEFVALGFCKI